MTRDELIRELKGYRAYDVRVDALLERRAVLRSKLYGIGSSVPDGTPRNPQPGNRVDVLVGAIDELEREIAERIRVTIAGKIKVEGYIEMASDPRGRAVLELYYLHGNQMWIVGQKMHYCKAQCWNIHNEAINDILKRLDPIRQFDAVI